MDLKVARGFLTRLSSRGMEICKHLQPSNSVLRKFGGRENICGIVEGLFNSFVVRY
jgi:hypothetical protein